MIDVDSSHITKAIHAMAKELSTDQLNKATASAINHTLNKARTEYGRAIRARYNLSVSDAKKALSLRRSTRSRLYGFVDANTKPIPLHRFNPTEVTTGGVKTTRTRKGAFKSTRLSRKPKSTGITVSILRGKRSKIPSAFFLYGKSGGLVMARGKYQAHNFQFRRGKGSRTAPSGKPDMPIDALRSVSIYGGAINEQTKSKVNAMVSNDYPNRLQHEVNRAIQRVLSDSQR